MKSKKRSKLLHALAAALILGVGVLILAYTSNAIAAATSDFICYWTAGQQLVHHANPYDGPAILRLEKAYGHIGNRPSFMRNPPWAFFMALPLGFLGESMGAFVWCLATVTALMVSARLLWIVHGRTADRLHVIEYFFPPVLACFLNGQIGIFLLLGVSLFLYLHERRPYLAGAALLICMLKPHLFLPFGLVVFAWILSSRSYRILIGLAAALSASLTLSFLLDPHGWSHYTAMLRGQGLQDEFIPTVSLMFRLAVDRHAIWLQFLPVFLGSLWAAWYFWKNRYRWDWLDHGSLLLLVSVMVAPYAWFTDEAVVFPAILAGLYYASAQR